MVFEKKKKMLIADDDEEMCGILGSFFSDKFEIVYAYDGKEAVKKAAEETPQIILLDYNMPGLSGPQVIQLLKDKEQTKDIPVIMITGQSSIDTIETMLEAGAKNYIIKPFNVVIVKEIVQRTLAEK